MVLVAVSEAFARQLFCTNRLWLVTEIVLFEGSSWSPRVLATKIHQRYANPWQEDASWEVVSSNPGAGKEYFLLKSQLNCAYIFLFLFLFRA